MFICFFQNHNFQPDLAESTSTGTIQSQRGEKTCRTLFEDIPLRDPEVQSEDESVGARGRQSASYTVLRAPHWLNVGDYDLARSVPNPRFTAELGVEATPSLRGSACSSPSFHRSASPRCSFRRSPPPTPQSEETTPSPTFII